MKKMQKIICVAAALMLVFTTTFATAQAVTVRERGISENVIDRLEDIYDDYNFTIGWGLYDLSGSTLKEVASKNIGTTFQSNCTIKAAMFLYICKLVDAGKLSMNTKLTVDNSKLHYDGLLDGQHTVKSMLTKLIRVSNSACFEVFHRYVGSDNFNSFLSSIGSGTRLSSYSFMGKCRPQDRAAEWFAIYKYCHSDAKNADFAWNTFTTALYSPIRDGLLKPVAHKSGWYDKNGSGSAGDCAVVKTRNGGCYLLVIFTQNNTTGSYNMRLIRRLAVTLDDAWDDYYDSLETKTYAKF